MLAKEQIVLNDKVKNPKDVTNLLFLVAKYHVYGMRCAKKLPNIRGHEKEILNDIMLLKTTNLTSIDNVDHVSCTIE